jgi:predicted Zn-dependent protease
MKALPSSDFLTLSAAEGWLMLGDVAEAFKELQRVSENYLTHPATLSIFWKALFTAQRWEEAYLVAKKLAETDPTVPFGALCMAQSLAEKGQIERAKDLLFEAEHRFHNHQLIAYNLACYCCRLGQTEEAREWVVKAIGRGGIEMIRAARIDPDLKSLRPFLDASAPSQTEPAAGPSPLSRFQWTPGR